MNENYSPSDGATPLAPYTTKFLSQRDLGIAVPINFVTGPGVSLSAACFSSLRFEDDEAALCLSNLLAVGFRRFEVDLYWDEGRESWSMCPVGVPASEQQTGSTPTLSLFTSMNSSNSNMDNIPSTTSSAISTRQLVTSSSSPANLSSSEYPLSTASSLGETLPSYSSLPDSSNNALYTIGLYTCTTTITLSTFTSQLLDYIKKTQNTIAANLLHIIVNVHAAASSSSPFLSSAAPRKFPQASSLLGAQFSTNLSDYLYTPSMLSEDRANINNSWYRVSEIYRPPDGYYTLEKNGYDIYSTEDGWPSEGYIELSRSRRLLVGFGKLDPQMQNYNSTADKDTIFPSGYIRSTRPNIIASSAGQLTEGCLFRDDAIDTSQVNSSWATATGSNLTGFPYPVTPTSDLSPFLALTSNITQCGISPFLNFTLSGTSAASGFNSYKNYAFSTIWSWGLDEPRNYTEGVDSNSPELFRCAIATWSSGWRVSDCSTKRFAACRALSQPYNWTINDYAISFTYAQDACPEGYQFAVPRTALENSYLAKALQDSGREFDRGSGAWIDFNSLDYEGCWVVGGPDARCPYVEDPELADELHRKQILVPTIAAIIVLIITALTVFAKAAGNRRKRKVKKKRADNGFIYEGVPS